MSFKGGKGGFRGKGKGKGGDREDAKKDDTIRSGPIKLYPDHPKLPKVQPFTEAQKSLLAYCREMEARYQKSDQWAEENVIRRLGVARWSDRFRVVDSDKDFFRNFTPSERYFPTTICSTAPPPSKKRKRRLVGEDDEANDAALNPTSLDTLEKMEASGATFEQEEPDEFSDDEEENDDNEFDDDFEFDYEDDGEIGLGDADVDAEL
mmetsp:Transcript_125134/g.216873  ORF Transcript_125134/g.216873 Transcript_125134/m.216873 type:complete len:207 (-) Transcript_125134:1000-1620(-)